MDRYLKFVFVFFILIVFLLEGLGINDGREAAYYLILLMPFFLFLPQFIAKGKKILFPAKFTFIFCLFMLFSLVSALFSVNLQNSFQSLFLYTALFLVFIFVCNHKELVKNLVLPLIFMIAFIFSTFSLFASFFIKQNSLFSIPIDLVGQGYQFIYSVGAHNHLGDFLLLPLTFLIFRLSAERFKFRDLFLLLFFIPYFIFAYSRSAYLDLVLVTLLILYFVFKRGVRVKKRLTFPVLGLMLAVILAVLVFAVPSDTGKLAFLSSLNATLQQKYDLSAGKTFFAYRNFYATEGLFSLASKPLFGVGPGNFGYASDQYTKDPTLHSDTGHNLFVDVFVENGMLAGIVFLTLFLLILSNIKVKLQKADIKYLNTNNVLYVFLFLAMLLNFQTDYTYLIHSFFLLFFVLLGLTYDEEDTMEIKFLVSALSLALLLIFNLAILSNIALSKGNYRLGFYAYPLNQDVYVPLVESQLAGNQQSAAFSYLNYYVKLFKGDEDVLTFAGNVYYAASEGDKALPFYERAFDAYNFADPGLIARIYNLKLDIQGQTKAKEFADKYFSILSGINNNSSYYQTYYYYRLAAFKVCQGIYSGNCPYAL